MNSYHNAYLGNDFFDVVVFSRKKKDGIYNKEGTRIIDMTDIHGWEIFDDLPCVQVEKNGRLYLYDTNGQALPGTEKGCKELDILDAVYSADGIDYAHPYRCTQYFTVQLEEINGRTQYVFQSNNTGKIFAVGHNYEDYNDYVSVCHYDEKTGQSLWTLYNKNGHAEKSARNVHALRLLDDGITVQVQKDPTSKKETKLTRHGKTRQAILFTLSFAAVALASVGGAYIYNDYKQQTSHSKPVKIDNTNQKVSRSIDYQNTK